MEIQVRASIDVYDDTLRYVVLERQAGKNSLKRLGTCDFDFSLDVELRQVSTHDQLDLVRDSVGEVLGQDDLSSLSVSLHPPTSYSFQTPLPEAMSEKARMRHLKQEASLLLGMMPSDDVHVEASFMRNDVGVDDHAVDWMHVTALQPPMHWRVSQMVDVLPVADFTVHSSMHAVVRLFESSTAQQLAIQHPFVFLIGWYPTHVEYILRHETGWYYDVHTDATASEDCAYLTTLMLQRFRVEAEEVGRIFLYGYDVEAAAFHPLRAVFNRSPEVLDPFALLHLDASKANGPVENTLFAPCLGAAL